MNMATMTVAPKVEEKQTATMTTNEHIAWIQWIPTHAKNVRSAAFHFSTQCNTRTHWYTCALYTIEPNEPFRFHAMGSWLKRYGSTLKVWPENQKKMTITRWNITCKRFDVQGDRRYVIEYCPDDHFLRQRKLEKFSNMFWKDCRNVNTVDLLVRNTIFCDSLNCAPSLAFTLIHTQRRTAYWDKWTQCVWAMQEPRHSDMLRFVWGEKRHSLVQ